MKTIYSLLAIVLLFSCNTKADKQITKATDYDVFLTSENNNYTNALKEVIFWTKKLKSTPGQYPYLVKLAGAQSQLFQATGNIANLIKAEEHLVALNEKTKNTKSGYLRVLARNYISQHRFKDALSLLKQAEVLAEDLKSTQKMLFDVYMELGDDEKAKHYLGQIVDFNSFDYLIRTAKWNDHKGNLTAAIEYMEKALQKAEASKNKDLMQWSYTNLADFYGHDGQIEKSYNHYLKALSLNPDDSYAKKGIAWIVYSHERNAEEALRILNAITKDYNAPDYYLLKADISEFLNDEAGKEAFMAEYKLAVKNKGYGDMYNAYNVKLYAEEKENVDKAITMAEEEVENRPTPQSYDLLAWAHFNDGNKEEALTIVNNHIAGKTFEPEVLYHMAEIYKANDNKEKVKPLKEELITATYELGPLMETKINQL